jgi:hypothetical protein
MFAIISGNHRKPGRFHRLSLVLAAVVVACAGCGSDSPAQSPASPGYPQRVGTGQVLLFRHATDHLVLYDLQERRVVAEAEATQEAQQIQYEFPNREPLYTSGDSKKNGFSVIAYEQGQVRTVLRAAADQGIFPIASDGKIRVVSLVRYDKSGLPVSRQLARLDGKELIPFRHVDGAVESGAIVGRELYYTVLVHPKDASYGLYSLDVTNVEARPKLVDAAPKGFIAEKGFVFGYRGQLISSDLVGPGKPVRSCGYYCYLDDHSGLMFALYPNNKQDLALDVVDLASKKLRAQTSGDIVDFQVLGEKVAVYMTGRIVTLDLGSQK